MQPSLFSFFFLFFVSTSCSAALLGPLKAPVYHARYPMVESPPWWSTVADFSHRGYSSPLEDGFDLDTEAQKVSLVSTKCSSSKLPNASLRPVTLSLYKVGAGSNPVRVNVSGDCLIANGLDRYDRAALGPGGLALPRQLAALTGMPPTFAYCLPPQFGNGSIFFGSRSYSIPGKVNVVQLLKLPMEVHSGSTSASYSVQLTGVEISGSKQDFREHPVVISSRSYVTTLPNETYSFVLNKLLHDLRRRGFNPDDPTKRGPSFPGYPYCFNMKEKDVRASPKLKLNFSGGLTWTADPQTYFWPVMSNSYYCVGILDQQNEEPATIGSLMQEGRIMEFDLEKKTLGFSRLLSDYGSSCASTLH